jgi:hypothetical protein
LSDLSVDSPVEGSNPELEAAAPERAEWLPSNFNDPADLAKSWKDTQGELTRAKQEAASARAALDALQAERQQAAEQQQHAAQQNDLVARYEQAVESGDYATQLAIQGYVAQQAAQQVVPQAQQALPPEFVADYADKAVAAKYGDWDAYKDRAAGWLAQNSYLITDEVVGNPNLLAQRLDVAYKAVKADDLIAGNLPAQATDLSAVKQAAQTMSGASARQPSQPEEAEAWGRIANAGSTGTRRSEHAASNTDSRTPREQSHPSRRLPTGTITGPRLP